MRMCYPLIIASVLATVPASNAEIYRCENNGRTIFTDQPCAGGKSIELGTLNTTPRVDAPAYRERPARYASDSWYEGASGYRTAVHAAQASKAPLLLYFYTDWCVFCRDVDNNLFSDSVAITAMRPFVKVRINPEAGTAEESLFHKMGGRGYPTLLVRPAGGKPQRVGVTRQRSADNPVRNVPGAIFARRLESFVANSGAQSQQQSELPTLP